MPRIRTIKPEFWTDEKLTECSLTARLLFIGLLNFADDNGNLVYSIKRLKMQIFPADNVDVAPLLGELIAQGILSEYSVSGEKFLNIKWFLKHQVINRPSSTKIPLIAFNDDSVSAQQLLTPGREKEGKGIGKERNKDSKTNTRAVGAGVARPDDVSESVWSDFLDIRKKRRAPLTDTALNGIAKEAERAGLTLEDCLGLCCSRGWQSFNANWDWRGRSNQRAGPTNLRDAVRQAVDDVDTWDN